MGGFRRLVIGLTDFIAVATIVISTVAGAFVGAAIGAAISRLPGSTENQTGLGLLVGAAIGFLPAAVGAALMFNLSEIATSTRKTERALTELLRGNRPSDEFGGDYLPDDLAAASRGVLNTAMLFGIAGGIVPLLSLLYAFRGELGFLVQLFTSISWLLLIFAPLATSMVGGLIAKSAPNAGGIIMVLGIVAAGALRAFGLVHGLDLFFGMGVLLTGLGAVMAFFGAQRTHARL